VIERYTGREMGAIWTDEARFARYLEVELCAAEELAALGRIPAEAARNLRRRSRLDLARIAEIEAEVRHDVIAFVSQVAETVGPDGRYLHYGLTSADVVDTALSMALVQAADLLLRRLADLRSALRRRAAEEAHTPTVGRTHGVHAEPTTFGLKLARHDDALRRDEERLRTAREAVAVGKLSGAVGTYAHLPPEVEERVCRRLGLRPVPIAGQVIDRDRHAQYMTALALLAGDLEALALEVRHLQRTEVGEAFEPFAPGQKGSSAMPHKRNPVNAEKVCGLARLVRSLSLAAMEDVALWHERDISHSSVERIILPDASIAVDHMLSVSTNIVAGLELDRARMAANLALTDGRILSERVLLALVEAGLAREEAYRAVQRAALDPAPGFGRRLREDPVVASRLAPEDLDRLLDAQATLGAADTILRRLGILPEGAAG
jgi:adenylosuccinate lyase